MELINTSRHDLKTLNTKHKVPFSHEALSYCSSHKALGLDLGMSLR